MIFTLEEDSLSEMEKHHLLIMESISSRKYKYPDKEKTEIIASRVSGFKKPSFMIKSLGFEYKVRFNT